MSRALLFNPIRARDGELEATLVARGPLLDELETAIVADAEGPTVRHWLIVAPRGSGKSHLTEALARRMRARDPWRVVRLPEESYRVGTLAELLTWIVGALDGVDRPFGGEADPERKVELATARLRRWRAERGPVLVVLENLQELLGRRFTRRDQQRLRALLMADPPFTLVGTSIRMFEEIAKEGSVFYDFLQERRLAELTSDEVVELVNRRATWDDATELLTNPEELTPRLRALYHLSGGNPRLVLALYGVLRAGLTREIYEQLLQLLDDITPYYQARLQDASPQGSRLLAEMAMAPGPLTPTALGEHCGLKVTQVTAVLNQLQEERFVRPGGRPEDKRARYWEVTDRLFRVWLQMREQGDGAGTIRFIVDFYREWYGEDVNRAHADGAKLVADALATGGVALEDLHRTLQHLTEALGAAGELTIMNAWLSGSQAAAPGIEHAWDAADTATRVRLAWPRLLNAFHASDRALIDELLQCSTYDASPGFALFRRAMWLGLHPAEIPLDGRLDVPIALVTIVFLTWLGELRLARRLRATLGPTAERLDETYGSLWDLAEITAPTEIAPEKVRQILTWLGGQPLPPTVQEECGTGTAVLAGQVSAPEDWDVLEAAITQWSAEHRTAIRCVRWARTRKAGGASAGPLIPPEVLVAGWSQLRGRPRNHGLLMMYAALRQMAAIPPESPFQEAVEVLKAPDRDAALSALHPEVREAVELLLAQNESVP